MEDKLIEVLKSIIPEVMRQGSMPQKATYPDEFFTFWNDSSDGDGFYDNTETAIVWSFTVCCYGRKPARVYEKLMQAKEALKQEGFIVTGGGYDVMSDEKTHIGRGIDVYFREN